MIGGGNVSEQATPMYGDSHRPYISAMQSVSAQDGRKTVLDRDVPKVVRR